MAIIYFYYLFDVSEFYKTVKPLIPELEEGDYRNLYRLAKQTMETKPEIWPILDNLFLGPPFEEKDEEPSIARWLMMLQAQYLQPIAEFNWGWTFLKPALLLIGWSEEDIQLLLFGKSLCTLLVPNKKYEPKDYVNRPEDLPWCAGYTTWLDLLSAEQLYNRLIESQEVYFSLSKQPQVIQGKIHLKSEVTPSLEWYSQGLIKEYNKIVKILTTVREAQKALAVAVA